MNLSTAASSMESAPTMAGPPPPPAPVTTEPFPMTTPSLKRKYLDDCVTTLKVKKHHCNLHRRGQIPLKVKVLKVTNVLKVKFYVSFILGLEFL